VNVPTTLETGLYVAFLQARLPASHKVQPRLAIAIMTARRNNMDEGVEV
jgi:hypothetical protein